MESVQPIPYEFITAIAGESGNVCGRTMVSAADCAATEGKLTGYGLTVTSTTTKGSFAFLVYEGPLAAVRRWLPEHEIRRYWYPPLPAGETLTYVPTKEQAFPGLL
ncbi:hypothetical protein MUG78_17370 [Gordonia alkaliphila]|uniref:hypothetical protein n=1 Tax=Gordonia alkaliphila TaxID=1053547 RepID=UPI001FF6E63E|nr:hypothetical protein [Gordonia alkaliphila]MCK0441172.1 hypothetical protein [Gordonia alkaliphila]